MYASMKDCNSLGRRAKSLLLLGLLLLAVSAHSHAGNPCLVFHLDAVSSPDFFRELEQGNLPNLAALFADGDSIRYGLTLFPGGTQSIYPSLMTGTDNRAGTSIAWRYVDHADDRIVRAPETLYNVSQYMPRRSRRFLLYQFPVLDSLASLSMMNVLDIMDMYGVAKVFWFSTDFAGHVLGEEAHRRSLYRFDRAIGRYLPVDELNDVNIILYTDHGMSFGDLQHIDFDAVTADVFGSSLRYCSYPNVYLDHDVDRLAKAEQLVSHGIDLVLYKDEDVVIGHHADGLVFFTEEDDRIRYTYQGTDPFSYYDALDYKGEYLDKEDWLRLTKDMQFPAVPPNLYYYLQNKYTGDLVMVVNPPKVPLTLTANAGNHAGLADTDLLVPVLFRGPDLDHLASLETIWLHKLYSVHVPAIDFTRVPEREKHSLALGGLLGHNPALSISLSPQYRVRGHLHRTKNAQTDITLDYDLSATFLTRNWLGVGMRFHEDATNYYLQMTNEFTLGRFSATNRIRYLLTADEPWERDHIVGYKVGTHTAVEWHLGRGVGVRYSW